MRQNLERNLYSGFAKRLRLLALIYCHYEALTIRQLLF